MRKLRFIMLGLLMLVLLGCYEDPVIEIVNNVGAGYYSDWDNGGVSCYSNGTLYVYIDGNYEGSVSSYGSKTISVSAGSHDVYVEIRDYEFGDRLQWDSDSTGTLSDSGCSDEPEGISYTYYMSSKSKSISVEKGCSSIPGLF